MIFVACLIGFVVSMACMAIGVCLGKRPLEGCGLGRDCNCRGLR
jgi:hypothetical protein